MPKLSADEDKTLRLLMSKAGLSPRKLLPKEKVVKLKRKVIVRIEKMLATEGFAAITTSNGKRVSVYSREGLRSLQKNAHNARSHKNPILKEPVMAGSA